MLETFLDFFQERILKQYFELQTQAIETFSLRVLASIEACQRDTSKRIKSWICLRPRASRKGLNGEIYCEQARSSLSVPISGL